MIIALDIWDWLGLGLILLALEIIISGVFLFWVGLAALTVSVIMLVLPDLPWQYQLFCFGLFTLAFVFGWSYFGRSRLVDQPHSERDNLNSRTSNYIGQIRPLTEAIIGGKGAIVIDDSRWVVIGEDMALNTLVRVNQVQGMSLVVSQAPQAE